MLRELQTIKDKNIDAMCKADCDIVAGMAIVKNISDRTVSLPSTNIVDGFLFASKERIPTGINCALSDMSDYHEDFNKIKKDEFVKLISPQVGERYATDAFVEGGLTNDCAVMVTSEGKITKANQPSRYIFGGFYNDAGHQLAIIEVTSSLVTNA